MPVSNSLLPCDDSGVARAISILREGGVVAIPTETVYGLAADASSVEAVAGIYRTKGRPSFNPLIVHVADMGRAAELAIFDKTAALLAERFWPGPLTLVLTRRPDARLAGAVTAGLDTVALRCPGHPVAQQILRESGLALAAPSANRSGAISPTRPEHVVASFALAAPPVLDCGPCSGGLESTIVKPTGGGGRILRPGPVTAEMIAAHVTVHDEAKAPGRIEAPGQMTSHYAPTKPVRLDIAEAGPDEWLIGFGPVQGDDSLSASGDLAEAAARLFDCLHRADRSDRARIAIAPVPDEGIGVAINDRLRRAAANRS